MSVDLSEGAVAYRELGDGRAVWVYRMMFTHKIAIGEVGVPWFDNSWCFATCATALKAFNEWNPLVDKEPQGWTRHPHSGRRRFPDGDPASEYVAP